MNRERARGGRVEIEGSTVGDLKEEGKDEGRSAMGNEGGSESEESGKCERTMAARRGEKTGIFNETSMSEASPSDSAEKLLELVGTR